MYRVDTAKTAIRGDISSRVPNSRTITINGVSYDLSANRSWTVSVPDSSLFATIYRNDTSNANIRNEYFKKSDTSNLLATKHIVTQLRFSGVTTKVLTLTFADGDTLQASFVDATSGGGSGIKNINGDTNSVQALVDDDGIVIVSDLSGNHVFYVDSSYVQTKYGVDTMRSNVYSAINGINGLNDGDKGDITVSGGGATWTILDEAVTEDKIAPDAITTNKILDNAVSNDKFRQSAGLSVVGRSANTTGDVADITAGSDYQVLRRSGSTIGFGQVDLGETNAVTGALKVANGGSGVTSITGVVIGNGASNYSAVTGTANQLLRRNAGNTAYEFFTPSASDIPSLSSLYLPLGGGTLTGAIETHAITPDITETYDIGEPSFQYNNVYAKRVYSNGTELKNVSLTAGTGISITGTYPSLTIAATGGGSASLTKDYIGFGDASNVLTGDSSLKYDGSGTITMNPISADPVITIKKNGTNKGTIRLIASSSSNLYTADNLGVGGSSGLDLFSSNDVNMSTYTGKLTFNTSLS